MEPPNAAIVSREHHKWQPSKGKSTLRCPVCCPAPITPRCPRGPTRRKISGTPVLGWGCWVLHTQLLTASQPFHLLLSPFWTIFSHPERQGPLKTCRFCCGSMLIQERALKPRAWLMVCFNPQDALDSRDVSMPEMSADVRSFLFVMGEASRSWGAIVASFGVPLINLAKVASKNHAQMANPKTKRQKLALVQFAQWFCYFSPKLSEKLSLDILRRWPISFLG